jgi:hypothetical protein
MANTRIGNEPGEAVGREIRFYVQAKGEPVAAWTSKNLRRTELDLGKLGAHARTKYALGVHGAPGS